jgi:hypothetical protein
MNGSCVGFPLIPFMQEFPKLPSEERTASLSVLIDPKKKACFEALCKVEDVTPSEVVCQLIQEYIEARVGPEWRDLILGSAANDL